MAKSKSNVCLKIEGISKTFYGPKWEPYEVEALRAVKQEIYEGEFLVLLGPSGCGKSTLLEIMGGLQKASAGEIYLRGEPVRGSHPSMSTIFQEESTFPWRTVRENVAFGLEVRGVPKKERRERAGEIIDLVGLTGFADRFPRELSGGMRQRVAIARGLAVDPEILLMDEPFGALDQQTRYFLGAELLRIWEETNKTIVFVTHDINEAVLLADRVWVMTHRPGEIKLEVKVDIPRPRAVYTLREHRIHALTNQLLAALAEESKRALPVSGF